MIHRIDAYMIMHFIICLIYSQLLYQLSAAVSQSAGRKTMVDINTIKSPHIGRYLRHLLCDVTQTRSNEFGECMSLCLMKPECAAMAITSTCHLCSYTNTSVNVHSLLTHHMFVDAGRFEQFVGTYVLWWF